MQDVICYVTNYLVITITQRNRTRQYYIQCKYNLLSYKKQYLQIINAEKLNFVITVSSIGVYCLQSS